MYSIELAAKCDLAGITRIYNESIKERNATADLRPVSVASREPWFDAHGGNRPIYVLKEGGEVSAWASLSDYKPREAYNITAEISVYVGANARGKGLGKLLTAHMLSVAPALGVKNVLAVIFADNAPSLAMFGKFGFEKWGELPQVCDLEGDIKSVAILGKRL